MCSALTRHTLRVLQSIKNTSAMLSCAYSNVLQPNTVEGFRSSKFNKERKDEQTFVDIKSKPDEVLREKYPEFLPSPKWWLRDSISERLERKDMYARRSKTEIPVFYVGSIMAVTVADKYGKSNRFVGLCIQRTGAGLRHNFTLRNVIDNQGVEIMYEMYSPLVQKIEVLRLEKRLDDELFYLRDCPLEYSYFPQDMKASFQSDFQEVPVNPLVVRTNPHPWSERWERKNLKGVELVYKHKEGEEKLTRLAKREVITRPWEQEDLMKHYRESINPVEQAQIYKEVEKNKGRWKSRDVFEEMK